MFSRKKRKSGILLLSFLIIGIISVAIVLTVFWDRYTVRNVHVTGNIHYTEEEIADLVMKGPLGKNSLYLSARYQDRGVEGIPFVDAMDVHILSPDTIEIIVYEKALAGYVKYMDSYMYFDRDGYVVECSDQTTEGIPQITGLEFQYVVLGEQLPVEDESIFRDIMDLTKLLDKYDLEADKIFFHSTDEITMYFGTVKVALGNDSSQLENKLMRLPQLLSKVEGKTGTLRMENLTDDKSGVTFQLNE